MKTFAKFRWHLLWGHSGPWLMAKRRSRSWCWGQSITTWSWGPWGRHTVPRRGHTITTESWGPWGPLLLTKMQSWDLWGPFLFIRKESCGHCDQHQVDVSRSVAFGWTDGPTTRRQLIVTSHFSQFVYFFWSDWLRAVCAAFNGAVYQDFLSCAVVLGLCGGYTDGRWFLP